MDALILRRNYPVPVTFADLRRAYTILAAKRGGTCSHLTFIMGGRTIGGFDWHAALKEATGAHDDVYAVVDGREALVATVKYESGMTLFDKTFGNPWGLAWGIDVWFSLFDSARDGCYWERPHEVRVGLHGVNGTPCQED